MLFYADVITKSLKRTLEVSEYRRRKQMTYNEKHDITPKGIRRPVQASLREKEEEENLLAVSEPVSGKEVKDLVKELDKEMMEAVKLLEFEKAALLRDQIEFLQGGADKLRKAQSRNYKGRKKYKYGRKKKHGGKRK